MLVSKVNKKEIIKNVVILVVLLAMIAFVVVKYLLPEKRVTEESVGTDMGVDIGKLLDVKVVKPKELDLEVFEEDKYLLLKEAPVERVKLENIKKGKTDLFPVNIK